MSSSWLSSEDPELQQAAVQVLGPAMGLFLHHEGYRDTVFESLPCLLQQYGAGVDNLHVTVSLIQVLEVAYGFQVPLPDGTLGIVCLALHDQVCDHAQLPRPENHTKVLYCLGLLGKDERVQADKEASRVASLSIFSGILAADRNCEQSKRVGRRLG
ncbi:hypothetical protein Y1Q_0009656 [Alligator mississippiensis]|uniref:MROH2B-like HEAT-repeats domain-containing protein n=1 Tax=Alligator mississippiensis TaxID=8496 RepID=A0A151NW26_ALLMI|nr:hypothetical protein Y1Q_0009656 [Alligator mississippiensis]